MALIQLVFVACVLLVCACTHSTPDRVSHALCQAPLVQDLHGAQLVLRGVNVDGGAKWTSWHLPTAELSRLHWAYHALGFNALRVLVFWEAIEPMPGQYNSLYLDALAVYIKALTEMGYWVIIDMHQDLFGEGFGSAGAPRWTCDESLYASFEEPDNWILGYAKPEVGKCFDDLYTEPEKRAAFAAAWAQLALRVAENPKVLAYDLFNEPFWGLGAAADFDQTHAPTLYGDVFATLRAIDTETYLGVEPAPTANAGLATRLTLPTDPKRLYMPHFYPQQVELQGHYNRDREALENHVAVLCHDAQRLALPIVIGEWGMRGQTRQGAAFMRDAMAIFDAKGMSALFWHWGKDGQRGYGIFKEDESLSVQGKAIVKPYVERIAGELLAWHWYAEDKVVIAEWREQPDIVGEHVVVVPTSLMKVKRVQLSPPGEYQQAQSRLLIRNVAATHRRVLIYGE